MWVVDDSVHAATCFPLGRCRNGTRCPSGAGRVPSEVYSLAQGTVAALGVGTTSCITVSG